MLSDASNSLSKMPGMASKTAGGMGDGVELSPSMQAMIARQPLKKILTQGGMDLNSDQVRDFNAALNQIKRY